MPECKQCGKSVKNLKLHERYAHPEAPGGAGVGGNKPQEAPIYSQPTKYVCQACKGAVKEGETPCSHCGTKLKWPGGSPPETALGGYECGGCGHEIKSGMKRCPGCGEDLEWD